MRRMCPTVRVVWVQMCLCHTDVCQKYSAKWKKTQQNREEKKLGGRGGGRWGERIRIQSSTCQMYSTELQANRVQRTENVAADLLSQCSHASFKDVKPEQPPSAKKPVILESSALPDLVSLIRGKH